MKSLPLRAIGAALVAAVVMSGCWGLEAARKHVAPESWVSADGTTATQVEVGRCKELSGVKSATMDTLDAKLASFDTCMHDHGYKMR